jgi:hypothetical protein
MAKKMTLVGKKAMFQMSIKGAKLPDNFEVFIDVEMDFEGAQFEDMMKVCASGQSARVALQAQLRAKPVPELEAMAKNGLVVKFNDIIAGNVTRPIDTIMALSKTDFVTMMIKEFEFDQTTAELLYNKKHGIVADPQ